MAGSPGQVGVDLDGGSQDSSTHVLPRINRIREDLPELVSGRIPALVPEVGGLGFELVLLLPVPRHRLGVWMVLQQPEGTAASPFESRVTVW